MKPFKLIGMSDFISEEKIKMNQSYYEEQYFSVDKMLLRIFNYQEFLKTPLTLGMFVPCDENNNPLDEPTVDAYMQPKEIDKQYFEYDQAKEKVLFEGFEIVETKSAYDGVSKRVQPKEKNESLWSVFYYDGSWNTYVTTIEGLSKRNLTLTDNAIKQILK